MSFSFLFPGQGSQSVGMLGSYLKKHKEVKATFKQASDVLSQDLLQLISKGPEEELNLTVNTQPVMLAAGVSLWRVWNSLTDVLPDIMSGHSLGEYTALTCAGVFEFEDAVRVVRKRAELMQAAVPASHGAMAAVIGLDAKRVITLCAKASEKRKGKKESLVEAANFNTATQIVVAGHAAAVKRLMKAANQTKGCRCVPLPVSVPAHSSLLKQAAQEFDRFLAEVKMKPPTIPVLHNTDVAFHKDPAEIRKALVAQMHTPVRWFEIVKYIRDEGAQSFIEIGPGHVLMNLTRNIDRSMNVFGTYRPENLEGALDAIDA